MNYVIQKRHEIWFGIIHNSYVREIMKQITNYIEYLYVLCVRCFNTRFTQTFPTDFNLSGLSCFHFNFSMRYIISYRPKSNCFQEIDSMESFSN